jgi:hypothetical protein
VDHSVLTVNDQDRHGYLIEYHFEKIRLLEPKTGHQQACAYGRAIECLIVMTEDRAA